jgi:GH25 family lysozyme M1 (1,4-beta-N-acetylmuramidase)
MMTIKGIDVSSHQSSNYSTRGMNFVFVKATEGRSYVNPKQGAQATHGREAGLVLGFYHFLWPGNIKEQARYFVDHAKEKPGDMLACDWEHTSEGTAASNKEKDDFIRAVKRLRPRYKVLLYCNRDFWLNRDTTSYAGDGLWIAQYNGNPGHPDIQASWRFHQYTSSPIDTNIGKFSSRSALRSWARERVDAKLTTEEAEAGGEAAPGSEPGAEEPISP